MSALLEFPFECKVIAGPAVATEVLYKGGVLGPSDVVAVPIDLTVTMTELPNPERDLPRIQKQMEAQGQRVVAVFVPGEKSGAWSDPFVKNIWHKGLSYRLELVLERLGFVEVEEDDL